MYIYTDKHYASIIYCIYVYAVPTPVCNMYIGKSIRITTGIGTHMIYYYVMLQYSTDILYSVRNNRRRESVRATRDQMILYLLYYYTYIYYRRRRERKRRAYPTHNNII
jgi:hypothetical protein